jgi:S-adenosylmethionine hydrolase
VKIPYQKATIENQTLKGTIVILDPQFGNIWTNISRDQMEQFGMKMGNDYHIRIYHGDQKVFDQRVPYRMTFGDVPKGSPLIYSNSLLNLALGINQGNFSERYRIKSGADWRIEVNK